MGKNTNGIWTREVEWPINAPSLPLSDAEDDPPSEGLNIGFKRLNFGEVQASIYDEGTTVDVFVGPNFKDVYDRVRDAYPRATWVNNGVGG